MFNSNLDGLKYQKMKWIDYYLKEIKNIFQNWTIYYNKSRNKNHFNLELI